jgi:hypothetical protein
VKTLGVRWNTHLDQFEFRFDHVIDPASKYTKRRILSDISKILSSCERNDLYYYLFPPIKKNEFLKFHEIMKIILVIFSNFSNF